MEHGHQELEAAGPVADQEHHADKVEYSHEHARHVQELKKRKTVKNCWKTDLELVEDDPAIIGEALEHWDEKVQAARPMPDQEHQEYQIDYLREQSNWLQQLKI